MSSPTLGRLLISHITLRGPELRQLYACIEESPGIHYYELARLTAAPLNCGDAFGLQEAALREALNFLLIAHLVEQQGAVRRRATFHAKVESQSTAFPLLLMSRIADHHDKRQRVLMDLHRQFVRRDTLALSVPEIRDEAERGSLGNLFAWTGEKVGFWARFCEQLGLVQSVARDNHIVFAPSTKLLMEALRTSMSDLQSASLATCLQRIDASWFACFTAKGTVHRGLSQTLIALHRLGTVRLSHSSDAAQSLLLGEWRVSDITLTEPIGD